MYACTQHVQTHIYIHTLTHIMGSLLDISKTLTTMFTHLRSTVACYHDNASSHNSLYWLKRSLIFSSRSQWTSNDMLVFQTPSTTALVDYHPPNENMRQWHVGDMEREREACDQEVASLNPGKAGKVWLGIEQAECSPFPQRLPLGESGKYTVSLDQWSFYWPLVMREGAPQLIIIWWVAFFTKTKVRGHRTILIHFILSFSRILSWMMQSEHKIILKSQFLQMDGHLLLPKYTLAKICWPA